MLSRCLLLALLAASFMVGPALAWSCNKPDWTCLTPNVFCYDGKMWKCENDCKCRGTAPCRPTESCKHLPRYTCTDTKHFCNGDIAMRCPDGTVCSRHVPDGISPCVHSYQARRYCPDGYRYLKDGVCAKPHH